MRKLWILCLAALLAALWGCAALAEEEAGDGYAATMTVAYCEEWVSLRAEPSASSERLAQVPLGAVVVNCRPHDAQFIYCEYRGQAGYILAEYLKPADLDCELNGVHVTALHGYDNGAECLNVWATGEDGVVLWNRSSRNDTPTELTALTAFVSGTAQEPRVMLYNLDGLTALDPASGEEIWTLPCDEAQLGASITAVTAPNGTMYIGGYYGPDPVAISLDGEILWRAEGNDDIFWLYELEITDQGLVATYDYAPGEDGARVCYSLADGSVLWMN